MLIANVKQNNSQEAEGNEVILNIASLIWIISTYACQLFECPVIIVSVKQVIWWVYVCLWTGLTMQLMKYFLVILLELHGN